MGKGLEGGAQGEGSQGGHSNKASPDLNKHRF